MIRIFALVLLSLIASGCAEAGLATAGTVAEIAAEGISTGADVYRLGKLDAADMVEFNDWVAAIHRAVRDLHLKMEKEEEYKEGKWRCTLADDQDTHTRIYVERRTAMLCWTRIDVGVLGSETTAKLLLARIRQHAPTPPPATTTAATTTASKVEP